MLRILLLVTIGAVAAWHFSFNIWLLVAALAIVALSIVIYPHRIASMAVIILLGAINMELHEREPLREHESRTEQLSLRMHSWAEGRIERLGLSDEARSVATSLTIANLEKLPKNLRADYSLSGMAHLLAISGLHVGFIFLIIFTISSPLLLLPHGYTLRSVVVILSLWLYALLATFTPSVVRATLMLSLLELGRLLSLRTSSLNILAATALFITMIAPEMIFSLSLQLSLVAVAAIIVWGLPLLRQRYSRYRVVNLIVANIVISLCCTIATMPLISHYFGYISMVGVVLSPVAMLLSFAIILLTFTAIFLPFSSPLGYIIEPLIAAQNRLSQWGAAQSWGIVEWQMSTTLILVTYTLFAIFTIYMIHASAKSK